MSDAAVRPAPFSGGGGSCRGRRAMPKRLRRAVTVLVAGLPVLGCTGADAALDAGPPSAATPEPAASTPLDASRQLDGQATGEPAADASTADRQTADESAAVDAAVAGTAPAPPPSTQPAPTTTEAPIPTVPPSGEPRLLTGLVSDVTPEGVRLRWSVDESRAQRITGFSCVYRSPAHIELGVSGAVGCPTGGPLTPEARSATLTGLPEYGSYDFEVVAQVASGSGEAIYWGERALRLRVAVTEALAGPPGPAQAVSGTGPLVSGCGPGDGPGVTASQRPWQRGQVVSDTHLTHYPGRGWSAGGDANTPPDWPEPRRLDELLEEAGLDGGAVDRAAEGTSDEQAAAAAALLADERGAAVVALLSARTKALLRPGPTHGWELRLHSGYPFGADYVYEPAHAVPGWGDPAHSTAWPALFERTDCPPPTQPDATHDVSLALANTAAEGPLTHSAYGWWVVAPVGLFPERIVATQGGLSLGDPAADLPTAAGTRWEGRLSGHLLWDQRRFAVAGDATFELAEQNGELRLTGRIDSVVLQSLDLDTLAPAGPPQPWRTLTLDAAAASDPAAGPTTDSAAGNASQDAAATTAPTADWSGALKVNATAPDTSLAMPAPDAFTGDWQAAAYGPGATEIAGRLRLWTPLADEADPHADWPAQAVLVAGFGAKRTP